MKPLEVLLRAGNEILNVLNYFFDLNECLWSGEDAISWVNQGLRV